MPAVSLSEVYAGPPRLPEATWGQIEAAIRTLDNDQRNTVYLQAPNGSPAMTVGGGAGHYMVVLHADEPTSDDVTARRSTEYVVLAPEHSEVDDEIELNIEGVCESAPAAYVVGIDAALQAARTFLARGLPSPSLQWEVRELY